MNIKINILPFQLSDEEKILFQKIPFFITFLPNSQIPKSAYNPSRGQYLARELLHECREHEGLVLGVTNADLYAEGLNFVFGQAEIGGTVCVISIARLRDGNIKLFQERIIKEAVHEVGHVLGLRHCGDKFCVMHFSNCLADTDVKTGWFCTSCEKRLSTLTE